MLGCVAAGTDTEAPSPPRPAVSHKTGTAVTAGGFWVARPYGTADSAIRLAPLATWRCVNGHAHTRGLPHRWHPAESPIKHPVRARDKQGATESDRQGNAWRSIRGFPDAL